MYRILCPDPHPELHSDYHPLTLKEVKALCKSALVMHEHHNIQVFSDIQCRLVQGIPGIECPHQIDGPVAEKQNELESAFMSFFNTVRFADRIGVYKEFDPHELAERLYLILNSK